MTKVGYATKALGALGAVLILGLVIGFFTGVIKEHWRETATPSRLGSGPFYDDADLEDAFNLGVKEGHRQCCESICRDEEALGVYRPEDGRCLCMTPADGNDWPEVRR